jgi:uncharacterized protein YdbL (DUF1318 family)
MNGKVRISEETLEKALHLLSEQYVSKTRKASTATNPERAEKYRAKAKEINAVVEAIAQALVDY